MTEQSRGNEKECPGKCRACGFDRCHDSQILDLKEEVGRLKSTISEWRDDRDGWRKDASDRAEDGRKVKEELQSLRSENERLRKSETALDDQLAIQSNEPTTKTDGYMAGLLNGMLLAKANFSGEYNPISYKDSKHAELQATIKQLGEAISKMVSKLPDNYERSSDWDILQIAKEALSLPQVKEIMEWKQNDGRSG